MKFERVPLEQVDWPLVDAFEDRTCCQRRCWLEFLRETQAGEPVIARLDDCGTTIGYFTGVIVRKLGVPIMGSPFPGWTTPYMGFNLQPGVSRAEAVAALFPFVFGELGCWHLELADPYLSRQDVEGFGFNVHTGTTFVSDLSLSENELLAMMDSDRRRRIRKSVKSGIIVEQAAPEGFADECYAHLEQAFARQNLKPTYGCQRVASLIRHVYATGNLLLLRARNAEGRSMATDISCGFNRISWFWVGCSLREYQSFGPHEAIHWYALRHWKARGFRTHDWGGGGDYKEKYGARRVDTVHFTVSRSSVIRMARNIARIMYYLPRSIKRARYSRRIPKTGRDVCVRLIPFRRGFAPKEE